MKCYLIVCYLCFLLSGATVLCDLTTNKTESIEKPENQTDSLRNDIIEIMNLIPRENITALAHKHLQEDDGFKLAVKYMTEPEWVSLVERVKQKPEWIALKQLMLSFGIPVDTLIHCLDSFVQNATEIGPIQDKTATANLTSFIQEAEGLIPLSEILVKLNEKLQTSNNMQVFLEKMATKESKTVFENALNVPEVKEMLDKFKEMGMNLYDLFSLIYVFFGWGDKM